MDLWYRELRSKDLDIRPTTANPLAQAAGECNGQELTHSDTQRNSSDNSKVADKLLTEEGEASLTINLVWVNWGLPTSLYLATNAARIGNCSSRKLSDILPIIIVLNTTALELLLYQVPGKGDPLITRRVVVSQAIVHVLGDLGLQVSFQDKSSNASSNLCNEDDDKQDAVGVDQTLILLPGSTAAEESNGKDDATKNDDENWSVDIIVTKEVQVVLGSNLRVSSKPDESNASNSKEDVTKNHEILD